MNILCLFSVKDSVPSMVLFGGRGQGVGRVRPAGLVLFLFVAQEAFTKAYDPESWQVHPDDCLSNTFLTFTSKRILALKNDLVLLLLGGGGR